MNKLLYCILYLSFLGIVSNFIGDTFKRESFRFSAVPFSPFKFEKGGEFYNNFKIKKWKDILPDMSKFRPSLFSKKVTKYRDTSQFIRLAQESCVAEVVHFLLIVFSVPCFFIGGAFWGSICVSVWTFGNIPFIMIQRYNRCRIISLLSKLELKNKDRA